MSFDLQLPKRQKTKTRRVHSISSESDVVSDRLCVTLCQRSLTDCWCCSIVLYSVLLGWTYQSCRRWSRKSRVLNSFYFAFVFILSLCIHSLSHSLGVIWCQPPANYMLMYPRARYWTPGRPWYCAIGVGMVKADRLWKAASSTSVWMWLCVYKMLWLRLEKALQENQSIYHLPLLRRIWFGRLLNWNYQLAATQTKEIL